MTLSAGDGSAHYDEDLSEPNDRTGDAVRNPAQVSFPLPEQATDAAMTYFYGQLFAMNTEIRAMIAKTARALMDRGAPRHLIRCDLSDGA